MSIHDPNATCQGCGNFLSLSTHVRCERDFTGSNSDVEQLIILII